MSINNTEIRVIQENKIFNGNDFHVFIYNKTESITGLHQHDYHEYTLVLTGRYYQEINGRKVLLKRGDIAFIPVGSSHQSFYDFGATRILNVGISKSIFDTHYSSLLPENVVASQTYTIRNEFLTYIETVIDSLNFREGEFNEFVEMVTFNVINRIRHYKEVDHHVDIPIWLHETVEGMYDKAMFSDNGLANMINLSGKTQEYLTRATQRYYAKTPMQIIHDIRIDFAKRQLEITNYSVTDIAYDAGYSNPSIFINNFKKLTTFTPNKYRRQSLDID